MNKNRFQRAIARFDEINSQDPNTETWQSDTYPIELLYAHRMTKRLMSFDPQATEELQLAARAQHISRWSIPRSDFPMNRTGYKQWRSNLLKYHAHLAGEVMQECGYDDQAIERVQSLIQKKRLKKDSETQTLEDVICLVFLEFYFDDFATKHTEEKLIQILKKTWVKMSTKGHEAALKMRFTESSLKLVQQAIAA